MSPNQHSLNFNKSWNSPEASTKNEILIKKAVNYHLIRIAEFLEEISRSLGRWSVRSGKRDQRIHQLKMLIKFKPHRIIAQPSKKLARTETIRIPKQTRKIRRKNLFLCIKPSFFSRCFKYTKKVRSFWKNTQKNATESWKNSKIQG